MGEIEWRCPVCGNLMSGRNEYCSGSFLDRDHPAVVRPVPCVVAPPTEGGGDDGE